MNTIKTFCNETLLLWGLSVIIKHVFKHRRIYGLGGVHKGGAQVLR